MQPEKPKPNYDFLNNQPTPPAGRFQLPGFLKHASRISLVSLIVVLVILFMVIIFGGSGSSYKNEHDLIARAQEIDRVAALVTTEAQDQDTKDLAATVSSSISSQQSQFVSYLKTHRQKVTLAKETAYLNPSTDTELTAAVKAGNLDATYRTYLKTSLSGYQNALQTAYKSAGVTERALITAAYNSNRLVLAGL